MSSLRRRRVLFAASVALCVGPALTAQQPSLDRRVVPPAGKTPELHVPSWTAVRLANGAQLVVSERHSLPLVSFSITFVGGANQYESPAKTGVGSLTASMLMEGTTSRTGDQLSNALQLL